MENIEPLFNVSKIKKTVISLSLAVLSSCSEKERLEGRDISLSRENTFVSTAKGIVVYESNSFTEESKSDTFKIRFSNHDWDILRKSFDKNQIYTLNDDSDIGESTTSMSLPKTISIKTNKRKLSINYHYFIGEKDKIDPDKSKKLKRFMRTFDSLIYYRIEKR
ncbi:hypothetical protein [Chryseobacterium herbae]|uniref:Lipoprotein n=1 Tax=Chryseobacterium herbae TaxID=2976476 RepID=A0ABT2IWE2_9FLAO|nr:hypothetical protein [Chryseobacterium sp. pc1-10]MCT2563102.1 hypothetical protein [Chryseobacterium sp. pc1-10]